MSDARWLPGYATSGLTSHRLEDALHLLHDEGYRSVVITPDAAHLDPRREDFPAEVRRCAALLRRLDLQCVVETGSRFLLDSRRKHRPTLLDEDSSVRCAFVRECMDLAQALDARVVSLWSGVTPAGLSEQVAGQRLRAALLPLLDDAAARGLTLGFEPEPGMFVATVADWHSLRASLARHPALGLALDCGHVLANEEGDPAEILLREREHLAWVALEDMKRGVHEHLPFGSGDVDLPALVAALERSGFSGVVAVELPRHAAVAVDMVRECRAVLGRLGAPFRA